MLKETTKNVFIGLARTAAPILAGFVLTFLTGLGLNVEDELGGQITLVIFGLLAYGYYIAATLLERYVSPKFGWLLLIAKAPEYNKDLAENAPLLRRLKQEPVSNEEENRIG